MIDLAQFISIINCPDLPLRSVRLCVERSSDVSFEGVKNAERSRSKNNRSQRDGILDCDVRSESAS